MSGLLSRFLQRATCPGGGLEPLRASRAALRAGAASSMTFPIEDVRMVVASARVTTGVAAREETPTVISASAAVIGESLAHDEQRGRAASQTVPQSQMGQSLTGGIEDAGFRETITEHETAKTLGTRSESLASSGEDKQKEFLTEHFERAETDSLMPLMTQAQTLVSASSRGVQEAAYTAEGQIPPVLEISIGHIEVQAAVRAPEHPRTPPFRPRVSLHDFLARSGRR